MVAAALGLLVTAPVVALAAAAVRLESPGSPFYRGRRVGRGGAEFSIYKLRTMRVGSDAGPAVTTSGDTRVTRTGRLLRRTKIDELPQLWNVLSGSMSLVGPRPEHPDYVALYSDRERELLRVRPGITSAASVAFVGEESMLAGEDPEAVYRQRVLPAKLAIDLEYLESAGLLTDLGVIAATVAAIVRNARRRHPD